MNGHNQTADEHKTDAKQLRIRVRKASGDISSGPSKIIGTELQDMDESHLMPKDLKNASLAIYNVFMDVFPTPKIEGCRFHLRQSWWRKIQKLGLSAEYKEKSDPLGLWLSQFFGLPFLPPEEVGDSFAEDIMAEAPSDKRRIDFADYVLETYVAPESRYPPAFWAAAPTENCKRTNNGPESFHAHFNEQFYSDHPNIYIFLDVIKKIQATTYIKIRALDMPAAVRKHEKEKLDSVLDKFQQYIRGDITRSRYIRTVAFKYSARIDL